MNPKDTATTSASLPSERIRAIFNAMGRDTLHLCDELYARGVVFIDPFHRVEGREALRAYYAKMYANVQAIRFDFEGETRSGDDCVLYWTMVCRHPRLNGGREISVPGCTRLVFLRDASSPDDGKVRLHRDYFDAGAMLYEQVPLLGRAVRFLRERV